MMGHDPAVPWLALLALGAVHGLNPAMGWLFAVGRALWERDRRAVWRALGPLAAGHAAAVSAALLVAFALGQALPLRWLRWVVAVALVVVGIDGLVRHRHVRLGGMRVSARELATWSFLMASAHGAGLMVLPFVLGSSAGTQGLHHHHGVSEATATTLSAGFGGGDTVGLAAALVHTVGYLGLTALVAVVVYEKVGLRILRRAWINLDLIWAAALVGAGVMTALL